MGSLSPPDLPQPPPPPAPAQEPDIDESQLARRRRALERVRVGRSAFRIRSGEKDTGLSIPR